MRYEEGSYRAKIVEAGLGESREKKTPQITLKVDMLGKYERDNGGEEICVACPEGYRSIDLYVTEKTMEYLPRKLRDAGFQGDSFDDIQSIIGNECDVTCKHEEGTGDNVGKIFDRFELGRVGPGKPVEHDPSVAKRLNALFGKMLKSNKPKPKAAKEQPVKASAGAEKMSEEIDDVPF